MSGTAAAPRLVYGRESRILKEAWLNKEGKLKWTKYWFVLDADTLTWFHDQKQHNNVTAEVDPKHRVLLLEVTSVALSGKGDLLEVKVGKERTLHLKATDASEARCASRPASCAPGPAGALTRARAAAGAVVARGLLRGALGAAALH